MRKVADIKGFVSFPNLSSAASDFRSRFLVTPLCSLLERNHIPYFTRLSLIGGEVIVSVTDEEFMLVQMAMPPGLSIKYA